MAEVSAEFNAGIEAAKKNAVFFLVVGVALAIGVLWWDAKKQGAVTKWLASKPLVGKLFS